MRETQCEFQSSQKGNHIKAVHDSVKIFCNQCEDTTKWFTNLNSHKRTEHEGCRYQCKHCDHQAKELKIIKKHAKTNHQGKECLFTIIEID